MSWKSLETRAKLEFHISLICTLDALSKKKHICMHLCIESIVKMMSILTKKSLGTEGLTKGRNAPSKRTGQVYSPVQILSLYVNN